MIGSSKLFIITVIFILISGMLFYQGIREQFLPPQNEVIEKEIEVNTSLDQVVASASAEVLGEQKASASESSSAELESNHITYLVIKVVDGDTIEVLINGQKKSLRFVGIDTPETVDPRRPVMCFGKEASDEAKRLLLGKRVILEKDISDTDRYKRILRYVYLPVENGKLLFVNDYLVREGFAKAYTYPPDVKFNEQFLTAQRLAQEGKKGLWGKCN